MEGELVKEGRAADPTAASLTREPKFEPSAYFLSQCDCLDGGESTVVHGSRIYYRKSVPLSLKRPCGYFGSSVCAGGEMLRTSIIGCFRVSQASL